MIAAAEVMLSCHQADDGAWACRPTTGGLIVVLFVLLILLLLVGLVAALFAAHYEIQRKPKR